MVQLKYLNPNNFAPKLKDIKFYLKYLVVLVILQYSGVNIQQMKTQEIGLGHILYNNLKHALASKTRLLEDG